MSNQRTLHEILQESAAKNQKPAAAESSSTLPPPWAAQMLTECRDGFAVCRNIQEQQSQIQEQQRQFQEEMRTITKKVEFHDQLFTAASNGFHKLQAADALQVSRLDAQADELRRQQVMRDQQAREQRRQNILIVINNGQQMPAAEQVMEALNIPAGAATLVSKSGRTMVLRMADQAAKDSVMRVMRPGVWIAHDLTPFQRAMRKQYKRVQEAIVKMHSELKAVWYADRLWVKSATQPAEAEYPYWRHAGVAESQLQDEVKRQLSSLHFSAPSSPRKRQRAGTDAAADVPPTTSSGAGNA